MESDKVSVLLVESGLATVKEESMRFEVRMNLLSGCMHI
jgi:hypothetical protein